MVRRALGVLVSLVALVAPAAGGPCVMPAGRIVVLKSEDIDPNVFVWDSRQRIVDYAAGNWRSTHDVLDHTLLAYPGTRAIVVQCEAGIVKPKYLADVRDAVGVRIINGPARGRYGWVTSVDVHELVTAR